MAIPSRLLAGIGVAAAITACSTIGRGNDVGPIDAAATEIADAEVRELDPANGTVALRHTRIENLDMPPMTMTFKLHDPALMNRLKVGQQVRFRAKIIRGTYTIIWIAPAT